MMRTVKHILLRCILNSCAGLSVEAELLLQNGDNDEDSSWGIGSVPVAMKAGRRERSRSLLTVPGPLHTHGAIRVLLDSLQARPIANQFDFDEYVHAQFEHDIGADIALALSLAFARATAASMKIPFMRYLSELGQFQPHMPHPLVNIFSGGIHGNMQQVPFQQIMIVPCYDTFYEDVEAALHIYDVIERKMKQQSRLEGYSASSGMLVSTTDYRNLLEEIAAQIIQSGYSSHVFLGVDIAAEHLKRVDGRYQFGGNIVDGDELVPLYCQLATEFAIKYIEDPFDPSDLALWQQFHALLDGGALLVGDDVFATNTEFIDKGVASGILLKMNQAGSIKATIEAALKARACDMSFCVSHRSCETEDTAMCDLAVAIGADFMKIGGPRRGDRIIKYNQLLRLAERL